MDITLPLTTTPTIGPGGQYIPEEDVVSTLSDGRTIQVAAKGVPMPYAAAVAAGLVKGTPGAVGPSETKETPQKKEATGSAPSQGGTLPGPLPPVEGGKGGK